MGFFDFFKRGGKDEEPEEELADKKIDQAVLHADNKLPFREVIGVLDALYDQKREMVLGGKTKKVPVFNMSFSVR